MVSPRRTESGSVRQEQILAAARKVFGEKGYEGTTISDIVKAAGVAQGTFYLYFPSKRDAFFALGQQVHEIMAKTFQKAYDPALPFEERLRVLTKAGFECAKANADIIRLVFFGADSISVEVQTAFLKNNPVIASMTQMFKRDIEAGNMEPIDPEIASRLFLGMIKNAFVEAFVLGDERDAQRLEDGVALIINGLRRRI